MSDLRTEKVEGYGETVTTCKRNKGRGQNRKKYGFARGWAADGYGGFAGGGRYG